MGNASAERVMAALGIAAAPITNMPTGDDLKAFRHRQAEQAFNRLIPKLYATAEPDHPDVLTWIDRYLTDPTTCRPLLLAGTVGGGKTWQAIGAVRRIVLTLADRGKAIHWRIISQPDLLQRLRQKFDHQADDDFNGLEKYLTVDLLLVDDLGAGKPSDWTNEVMYRLVEQRLIHCRPTIYTTNLDRNGIVANLGDRIGSRLRRADRVTFGDGDRRRDR